MRSKQRQQRRALHRKMTGEIMTENLRKVRVFKGLVMNRATRRRVDPFDKSTWRQH